MPMIEEHGFVGNIWVRQNFMEKAGDAVGGHIHYHDHVSLLAKGKVSVQIDDGEPKEFVAPTFIVVRKEHKHRITALEDGTVWYCVFAMRDIYGDVTEIIDEANVPIYPEKGGVSKDNPPLWSMSAPDDYWDGKEINRGFSKSPSVGPTWVELDHDHGH
jgi:hypothetical protein